jgi:small subunit ribosomal protein S5
MVKVPLRNGTVHHNVTRRARRSQGAAGAGSGRYRHHRRWPDARCVRSAGRVTDIVAKSLGSSNPYNMVRATFDALKHARPLPAEVAAKRGKSVEEIFN